VSGRDEAVLRPGVKPQSRFTPATSFGRGPKIRAPVGLQTMRSVPVEVMTQIVRTIPTFSRTCSGVPFISIVVQGRKGKAETAERVHGHDTHAATA
jgi:hypothetical protein